MTHPTTVEVADAVRAGIHPLGGEQEDYDPLMELIGDARIVLIGEASHGTQEFYRERARITSRLIEAKNFCAVAVEADWPDAYRVTRYIRRESDDAHAEQALRGFERFPTWMWRNTVVEAFVEWMRGWNDQLSADARKVGFYGLDLYSLFGSIAHVIHYLDSVDPAAAARARQRYACFDHFAEDSQAYGYASAVGMTPSCEGEVVEQLVDMRRRAAEYADADGRRASDEFFAAEQNARLVRNAERYYREMFGGRISSWNLRDTHMAETLDALVKHLVKDGKSGKVVVWAHNSHLGDARATEVSREGELNVGQLVRERYGSDAALVGFTTYSGTVTAARDWDRPAEQRRVRPALGDSYEGLFHEVGTPRFLLDMRQPGEASDALRESRLERAIGVIYRPETERLSHYFFAELPSQFDAVIHLDETTALEPLERNAEWQSIEPPETYPTGM